MRSLREFQKNATLEKKLSRVLCLPVLQQKEVRKLTCARKWDTHTHPKIRCTCTPQNEMRIRLSKRDVHTKMRCPCAPKHGCACAFYLRRRILFWSTCTHLILICARASRFVPCTRILLYLRMPNLIFGGWCI